MQGGGAQHAMLNLARGVAKRGYAVDLVLAQAEGPLMAEVPDSVRVVDLEASRVLMSLLALVRYLRRQRPLAMLAVWPEPRSLSSPPGGKACPGS